MSCGFQNQRKGAKAQRRRGAGQKIFAALRLGGLALKKLPCRTVLRKTDLLLPPTKILHRTGSGDSLPPPIMKMRTPAKMVLLLVLALLPLTATAQFTFTTNADNTLTITGYTGSAGNVTIPSTNGIYPVTAIGGNAFNNQSTLTGMTIPDSVTSIGNFAFGYCSGLTSVTIGNNVTSIGNQAFLFCSSLTSVTIPNSVTSIGNNAFEYCSKLTNIVVIATNLNYMSVDGVLFNKPTTTLLQYPGGLVGSYVIPNTVTYIAWGAFGDCTGLMNVTIPNGVTNIGGGAFNTCTGLPSVTIPNSVTSIGEWTFSCCSGLTNLTIPKSVTNIDVFAFDSCLSLHQAYFQGNAPNVNGGAGSADNTVFFNTGAGTVYYLPGTTGWGTNYGGWPTALWNPNISTTNANFGVKTNHFCFTITGTADIPIVVEAGADLGQTNWTPLFSGTVTNGAIYFSDPAWSNYPSRLYRIRSP